MPELPEVETVRVWLEPKLVGRRFQRGEIFDPRLTRPFDPAGVAAELQGERVAALDRRGKYLIVEFESGRALLIHLRMTGQLLHSNGGGLLVEPGELAGYLAERVGREPLAREFTAKRLAEVAAGRRAPIKTVLLDQRRVAGVGNIYADEALWRARIHPLRPAGELDAKEVAALHRGIRAALNAGIVRQGATLSNYRTPDGSRGRMQEEFRVYGRAGEPCDRCGSPIEKIRAAGRGTWYCPSCQRRGRRQAASSSSSRPSR